VPKIPDLVNGFKMLKEVDLNAVRTQAEIPLHVIVIGEVGAAKTALVEQLLAGPRSEEPPGLPSIAMHRPDLNLHIPDDTLALLFLDVRKTDLKNERAIFDRLIGRKIATVVCYNKSYLAREEIVALNGSIWTGAETAVITAIDRDTLMRELVPAILRVCKGHETRLARHLPLLRAPVAQKLIDDTCFINATYSLSTGLAEIVPILNLPLNLADIVILTKNQALMAYTITLAMGMQAEWRDTMPKLAAVVGSAFLWRQLARYLSGLIPVIGIVPKVVIAYSGTYVIGKSIYQWCANGEKLNPEELRALYAEALERGSEAARVLIAKSGAAQYQATDKFKEIAQLISERSTLTQEQASSRFQSAMSFIAGKSQDTRQQIVSIADKVFKPATACSACGKKAPKGAGFCAFCGKPLNS
jgi:uncharacterized protein (DUF697 family)